LFKECYNMFVGIYKKDENTEYSGNINFINEGHRNLCKYHLSSYNGNYIKGEFEVEDSKIASVIKKLNTIINISKSQKT